MKDHLAQLLTKEKDTHKKFCLMREYLQARILQALQSAGAFTRWAFCGGTALRFLYSLPRFSEDLDFSLHPYDLGEGGFRESLECVQRAFANEGYEAKLKLNDKKTVASAFIVFPGLLYSLGLSPHASQNLSIKLEVDTRPPSGAVATSTLVRRHVTLHIQHYDKASLLAGKLHALLSRTYTKGRDIYDLVWYLADPTWPMPNLTLLNAAIAQSHSHSTTLTESNWRKVLRNHLDVLDWVQARRDVEPFLERTEDVDMIDKEKVLSLLG